MGRARLSTLEADETGDRSGSEREQDSRPHLPHHRRPHAHPVLLRSPHTAAREGCASDVPRGSGGGRKCSGANASRYRPATLERADIGPSVPSRARPPCPPRATPGDASAFTPSGTGSLTPSGVDPYCSAVSHDGIPPLVADARWWMLRVGGRQRAERALAA